MTFAYRVVNSREYATSVTAAEITPDILSVCFLKKRGSYIFEKTRIEVLSRGVNVLLKVVNQRLISSYISL